MNNWIMLLSWSAGILAFVAPVLAQSRPAGVVALRVKTDVAGAEVELNGKPVGVTPLNLPGLADGKYSLKFSKPGYEEHAETIDIRGGKPASIFVVLKPLDRPLPTLPVAYSVAHLHVNDACSGILTVNTEGVDFRASSGSDLFAIPLSKLTGVIRRQSAAYLHTMGLAGTVVVGTLGQSQVASVHLTTRGRNYTFLVLDETGKNPQPARTLELYGLLYLLWDRSSKDR